MIHLSTINETNLTTFHRNHFILSVTDLKDTSVFKDHDFNNENHISIETCKRIFPEATKTTIANLILTTIQIKIGQGQTNLLFVFNEENEAESFDVVNGLTQIFNLKPSNSEQNTYFEILKGYAGDWTQSLLIEEERFNKIGSIVLH